MEIDTRKFLRFLCDLPALPPTLLVPTVNETVSVTAALSTLLGVLEHKAIDPVPVNQVAPTPKFEDVVGQTVLDKLKNTPEISSTELRTIFGHVPTGLYPCLSPFKLLQMLLFVGLKTERECVSLPQHPVPSQKVIKGKCSGMLVILTT